LEGTGCTSCTLQNLRPWARHKQILKKYNTNILLVINHSDEQVVIETLTNLNIFDAFNIVFDKTKQFRVINDRIFQVARDGVFVMDKDITLTIATLIVYCPILFNDFLFYWDDQWVVMNHYTEGGLSFDNIQPI
jgi:hypothetical protein